MSQYIAQVAVGGVSFAVPFANHEWAVVAGYVAPIQQWVMPAEKATAIMAAIAGAYGASREATLTFGDPDNPTTVQRAYVVGTAPADNPQRLNLLLADVRWYLFRQIMVFDVNVRRRVGDKRLIGNALTDTTIVDSVAYGGWSTNNGTAYTWTSLKDQALAYLTIPRHGRPGIQYVTDSFSINFTAQTCQETTTDANGTLGLARAIESVPGAGVYVDLAGVLHVYDATPGAEISLVNSLPKSLMDHGDLQLVDNSSLRPLLWRIYVDYAIEVRFDYNPPTTNDAALNASLLITQLENVLQVTDQQLVIPIAAPDGLTAEKGRTVAQGTWITTDEAFAAWGTKQVPNTSPSVTLPALSDDMVAEHYFGDLLQEYGLGTNLQQGDPVWLMRVAELKRCYRTFFRINAAFMDKIRHLWNERCAIWDSSTGTRAPSPVYCNFNLMPVNPPLGSQDLVFGSNVTSSYASSGFLAGGAPSGFRVNIEDEELGIISIERDPTKFPLASAIAPSPVQSGQVVTAGPGQNEAVYQKLIRKTDPAGGGPWSLSVVLTCSPDSPNDLRRLYEIQVSIEDAATTAGVVAPLNSYAPDQELRTHLTEARVAWQDTAPAPAAVVLTFGGSDTTSAIGPEDPVQALTPINLKQELVPLAKSLAAVDLLSKLDHYEGSKAVPMSAKLVPLGSINKVVHRVIENRAVSVIHCEPNGPHWNAIDLLPSSARSFILKEIQGQR